MPVAALLAAALLLVALPAGAQQGRSAAPVIVAAVQRVAEAPTGEYSGRVEPLRSARVAADLQGRVVAIHKRVGDRVEEGDLLAELDNPTLRQELLVTRAQLDEREAQLELAQQQQQRRAFLYQQRLTSSEEYEDGEASLNVTEAQVASARAQVERLEQELALLELRSPVAGEVVRADLELGQWLSPSQTVFQVYDYSEFELLLGVPGRFLGAMPATGEIAVRVPDAGAELTGRIAGLARHVEGDTGTFQVRVRVPNPDDLPLSGMMARARLPLAGEGQALAVPRDALVRNGERTHVVVVRDGAAEQVVVNPRGSMGDAVIVELAGEGDLQPGEQVVVRGNERLAPGAAVRVTGTQGGNA